MPKWAKALIAPAVIILAVVGVILLDHFELVRISAVTLPDSPEFNKFSADLPTIGLAFLFGVLGAFVRGVSGSGKWLEGLRRLTIGGAVGVIVFFVLKSEVIPQIIYDNLPDEDLEVSYYGMALLAVFGGMYSGELTRWASRKS